MGVYNDSDSVIFAKNLPWIGTQTTTYAATIKKVNSIFTIPNPDYDGGIYEIECEEFIDDGDDENSSQLVHKA